MYSNQIVCGDAVKVLADVPAESVDLVVTDPPYLVSYKDRLGRVVRNDHAPGAVLPVFDEAARVLRRDAYAISFCGWSATDRFVAKWSELGLTVVGRIVWAKPYASNQKHTSYCHELAYVLAKGRPIPPVRPLADVQDWTYSGNRNHPTEKAVSILEPLVTTYSKPGGLVLDPFCGSGSTAVAAALTGRQFLAIDVDPAHCRTARRRVQGAMSYVNQAA